MLDMTQATIDRFHKVNERTIKNQGFGASAEASAITKSFLIPFSTYIETELMKPRSDYPNELIQGFISVLRQLDPKVIALCVIANALGAIAHEKNYRDSCITIGGALYSECWGAKLLQHDGKLAGKIKRHATLKSGNVKYRRQAARSMAARAGFKMRAWPETLKLRAGSLLTQWLVAAVPEVFVLVDIGRDDLWLLITDGAEHLAMKAVEEAIRSRPVFLPSLQPPLPWTDWARGGYADDRRRRDPLLRSWHKGKGVEAATKAAIRDGSMQPFLDALNTIQAVPWTINKPVLEIMQQCITQNINVKGLPLAHDIAMPERQEEMNESAQRLWRVKAGKVKAVNRGLVSERVQLTEDMRTAELLSEADGYWTPCNCDWRGRAYPMPHFNFQRDDRVRALFRFRDGAPIGEDGLWWLKVHVANCGEFDNIHKRPLEERVAWVDSKIHLISQLAEDAFSNAWWTKADKPFMFLAACLELVGALSMPCPADFLTALPVSFDGSCSGLQHLSAMTRAPEGSLVNLTPSPEPQDVYTTVANVALLRIQRDLETEDADYARMCLAFGVSRKLVKRNVMTFSYSSKRFGMAQQHMEDTMVPLRFEVLSKALEEHPFTDNELTQQGVARYLAGHVYTAITEVVDLPARAMGFLQTLAKALAHESKALSWVTPTGLPWSNQYYVPTFERISLYLQDIRVQVKMATGNTSTIDKGKASNGVAPNFVHALDAAHLMLTVNAAAVSGITAIATVHDSFGCLAPHARRFNQVIREEFVRMYETHDVLAEVLDAARRDLTPSNSHRLPEGLQYGSLDLRQVLKSDFAFA